MHKFLIKTKNPFKKIKFSKLRTWKLWKKILLYGSIILFLLIGGTFAWFSKDLPTPGKIRSYQPAQATQIFDRNGNLLYSVYGQEQRESISFSDMPQSVKDATIATEDKDFYKHHGVKLSSIIRALVYDLTKKSILQGGSTITQQYVKNALLTPKRTFSRKVKEVILSIELEIMYPKDKILEMYLNEIPYGSNIYGVQAAAKNYFGKDAKNLTLAEGATLAALVQRPTYFYPYGNHTDELLLRRNYVLDRMKDLGYINQQQADEAKTTQMVFIPRRESMPAPHFIMYVKEVLADKYGDRMVEEGGLKVTTTLDPNKQKIAEEAIAAGAASNFSHSGATNGAMVAIDPKTGDILAMVGSKDYFDLQHDGNVNVTISKRQPGSAFKPIVYATGFKGNWGPGSTLWDVKTDFGGGYAPNNYTMKNYGPLSIRQALAGSINVTGVKMLYLAGINNSLKTASDMGITTLTDPNRYGLSLVLGGGEIKLLELTGAYGVFANTGVRFPTNPILKVEDPNGKILEERKNEGQKVLEPQIAYEISSILSDNSARSFIFGSHSALVLPNRTAAAKTGTTDEFRDGWTIGYTPSLVTGVWVGNNDNSPMTGQLAASMAAAPIWNQFMTKALEGTPSEEFSRPDGLEQVTVDNLTGKLPSSESPFGVRSDIFADWQKPKEHGGAYIKVKIDTISGKLATDDCPNFVQEKVFANVHSEVPDKPNWENPVRAWAAAHGIGGPSVPTEKCPPYSNSSISITSPQNGASVTGTITIKTSVNAPSGVKQVEFRVDAILIDTDYNSPYQTTYNLDTLSPGNHSIKATVIDNVGFSASDTISISVGEDTDAPGKVTHLRATWKSATIIELTWNNPNDADLAKNKIYISTSAGSLGNFYTQIGASPGGAGSIQINVTPGKTYWFAVTTVDSSGNENLSINQVTP